MRLRCQTQTKSKRKCKKRATIGNNCHIHAEECIICLFRLTLDNIKCGRCRNIFHTLCIVKSGNELCPTCRYLLTIPIHLLEELNKKKRELYEWNYINYGPTNPFIQVFFDDLRISPL